MPSRRGQRRGSRELESGSESVREGGSARRLTRPLPSRFWRHRDSAPEFDLTRRGLKQVTRARKGSGRVSLRTVSEARQVEVLIAVFV
jgi:hypothetical protein